MPIPRRILVTGATGKQGGTLARLLLSRGHQVRALTRNPNCEAATKLKKLGAEVARGSMEDSVSMTGAMRGIDAVFLVTTPFESGVEEEARQGRTVADAAANAGVGHVVYSSLPQVQTKTGIPFFDSKATIEGHITSLGIPYTILAPAFFMENLSGPYYVPGLHEGHLRVALSAACRLQMVSVEALASFAALVLEQRQAFAGKRIEIASDELTPTEVAQTLSRAIGRNISYCRTPIKEVRAWSADLATWYDWLDHIGTHIDIERLMSDYTQVDWQSLRSWAETQSWGVLTRNHVEELA
ncbi:MAG: nucleoside-diphosphate sugar epimerase [Acidobacteria bacterium]|nr:MAG: nucleoside-diphosphate sugar epimerase [Acidobacteriota bacterium]